MTQQNEAPLAPATAVEANPGAPPSGETSPTNPGSEQSAAAVSPTEAPTSSPAGETSAAGGESASTAESSSDDEGDDEGGEGEGEGEGEGASASGEAGAAGDPAKKKRRRRRRKKGAPGAQAGAEGGPAGEQGDRPQGERPQGERQHHERPAREGAGGVFARFFDASHGGGKRHAFAPGEVVAGRVVRVNPGAFAVDLFGKATAYVDIFEPREVPAIPEPAPEAAAAQAPAAADAQPVASDGQAEDGSTVAAAEGGVVPTAVEESPGSQGGSMVSEGGNVPSDAPIEASQAAEPTEQSAVAEQAAEPAEQTAPAEQTEAVSAQEAVAAPESSDGEAEQGMEAAHDEQHDDHHEEHHEEHADDEPEPEPPPPPALGEIFRGRVGSVAESGHIAIVNRIIDVPAAKQKLVRARDQRRRVRGVVFGFNRGGFDVLVEGIRVFCPASGMSLTGMDDPHELLGQRLDFTVPPAKAGTHGIVVSRRGILERQSRKAAKQLLKSLQPGQRLKGRVTQVREFGLFVDLGGIEGLVHQSELSFSRGVKPQDVAKPGDELEVQVLRVGEGQTRKERERVSLSLKTLQDDPWSQHEALLEPGTVHTGKVVRTTEFGAFIEIVPQLEGLLHISEIGRELKHANQALNEGDELRVVVERVDRKQRRISLSRLSQAEEKSLESGGDAKSGRPPKPGQHITVVVDKVEHAGLIVQIPGVFGKRGRGFIPNMEMGTERGTDHRKGFPNGTQIPVKVIGIDRDGGFRFSRKALVAEEEKRAVNDYRKGVAGQGLGTFGDLLRKKLEGKA